MNAKKAKQLRRIITSNPEIQPSYEDLLTKNPHTGELKWDRTCQRGVYRELKKQIRQGLVQL